MNKEVPNFVCKYCGNNKALMDENDLMVYARCTACNGVTLLKSKYTRIDKPFNKPMCPTCHSINVEKISTTSKVIGVATLGIFSNNAKCQFRCKNCGYKW